MTLKQLEYLVEIAKCSTLTQASKNLYTTQPNLTKTIKDLEEELGFPLMHRDHNGIFLTDRGMEFVRYASHIVEEVSDIYQRFGNTSNKNLARHTLNVSGHHFLLVADTISSYLNSIPSDEYVYINYSEGSSSKVIDDVVLGKSELGLLFLSSRNHQIMEDMFKEHHLKFTPLLTTKPCAYLSPSHPLASCKSLTMKDLEDYPYICYEASVDSYRFAEEPMNPSTPKQIIYVHNSLSMMHIISHTTAYNIGSGMNCSNNPIYSQLTLIPIDDIVQSMTIGYISSRERELSNDALKFLKHLEICTLNSTYITPPRKNNVSTKRKESFQVKHEKTLLNLEVLFLIKK